MTWIIFSFLTALLESAKDILSKRESQKADEYILAWSLNTFALFVTIPLLLLSQHLILSTRFFSALIVNGSLNVVASILYMRAIKYDELSLSVPFIAFTPLFLLIMSFAVLGEVPSIPGGFGILFIVVGSYVISIDRKAKSLMYPFKSIVRKRGPRLMLFVSFLWAVTSTFDKIGIVNSSPFIWVASVNIFLSIGLSPFVLLSMRKKNIRAGYIFRSLAPIGILHGVKLTFQMIAISQSPVVYVISIKRLSSVFTVFSGGIFFREKEKIIRILGSSLMVLGALLITLSK